MKPFLRFLPFVAGIFAASASAQLIVDPATPGSFSTIQSALHAAGPGDSVLVMPGTYYGPVVISKPVTLLGLGMPEIRHQHLIPPSPPLTPWTCVVLQGPGIGKVVIAGFKIGSKVNGNKLSVGQALPGIWGSGFDELHVLRCQVRGPMWINLSGVGTGHPAISVTVPNVVISHSDLQGSTTETDWEVHPLPPPPPSVLVNGTLTLMDSVVHGAPGPQLLWVPGAFGSPDNPPPQPCPCPVLQEISSGGPGIQATLAFVVNSVVIGGLGGKIQLTGGSSGWQPFGNQPDGRPWTANSVVHDVPAIGLEAPLPMQVGQPWSVVFPVQWSTSSLYASFDISPPYALGGQVAFLQNVDAAALLVPGTTSIGLTWPSDMALLGIEIVWQLYDPVLGLSRPVFDIMMP